MNDAKARPPRRRKNAEIRGREYLEESEVDRLRKAAAELGRYGHRDATMILRPSPRAEKESRVGS